MGGGMGRKMRWREAEEEKWEGEERISSKVLLF